MKHSAGKRVRNHIRLVLVFLLIAWKSGASFFQAIRVDDYLLTLKRKPLYTWYGWKQRLACQTNFKTCNSRLITLTSKKDIFQFLTTQHYSQGEIIYLLILLKLFWKSYFKEEGGKWNCFWYLLKRIILQLFTLYYITIIFNTKSNYPRILIGSYLWSIGGQMHRWRH